MKDDGIDHINIYSKGKTKLGRALSNFSHLRVNTIDGSFESIEGYWYWLGCNDKNKEKLRKCYGFSAKKLGRELRAKDWNNDGIFKIKILSAMLDKLLRYPNLFEVFKKSSLPFKHYYCFGYPPKIIEPKNGKWIVDSWEFLRSIINE